MNKQAHSRDLRRGRFSQPGQVYHITSSTYKREPVFNDLIPGRYFVKALMSDNTTVKTLAYVLMPDHFHWLSQCGDEGDICKNVARVKSISAHTVNKHLHRTGKLWQSSFHDHAIRKEEDIVHVARYIVANPLRAGLVKSLSNYPFWDAVWI